MLNVGNDSSEPAAGALQASQFSHEPVSFGLIFGCQETLTAAESDTLSMAQLYLAMLRAI
jgi:hypothetical protein